VLAVSNRLCATRTAAMPLLRVEREGGIRVRDSLCLNSAVMSFWTCFFFPLVAEARAGHDGPREMASWEVTTAGLGGCGGRPAQLGPCVGLGLLPSGGLGSRVISSWRLRVVCTNRSLTVAAELLGWQPRLQRSSSN